MRERRRKRESAALDRTLPRARAAWLTGPRGPAGAGRGDPPPALPCPHMRRLRARVSSVIMTLSPGGFLAETFLQYQSSQLAFRMDSENQLLSSLMIINWKMNF